MSQKKGRIEPVSEVVGDLVKGIKKYLPTMSPGERCNLFAELMTGYCGCGSEMNDGKPYHYYGISKCWRCQGHVEYRDTI